MHSISPEGWGLEKKKVRIRRLMAKELSETQQSGSQPRLSFKLLQLVTTLFPLLMYPEGPVSPSALLPCSMSAPFGVVPVTPWAR